MKKFLYWLVKSSADSARLSLTIRGALLAIVPTVLGIVSAACGFGVVCLGVDQAGLNQVIEWVVAVVQAVLAIVSAVWVIQGLVRKLYITVRGWFGE